jgi:hypothetical protein
MVYTLEIPVDVLLYRQWTAIASVIEKVCEYLPRTHQSSYINTGWRFRARCVETAQVHPDTVLRASLWYRHLGIDLDDPDVRSVVLHAGLLGVSHDHDFDSPEVRAFLQSITDNSLLHPSLVLKSTRLAFATMVVGFVTSGPHTNLIDNNMEMLRLLSQGPWKKLGSKRRRLMNFQLVNSFNMLIIEAALERNVSALRDLWALELVYAHAFENVLQLGTWPYSTLQDFTEVAQNSMSLTNVLPHM